MAGRHRNPRRPYGPPNGGPPTQPPNQSFNSNFGHQDPSFFQFHQSIANSAPYSNFPMHNPTFFVPQNPSFVPMTASFIPRQDITNLAYSHSQAQAGARHGSQSSSLPPQQVFHDAGNQYHTQGEGSKFQHQNSSVHRQQVFIEPRNQYTVLAEGLSTENCNELVQRAEEAVVRARSDIASSGESVSSWKVAQTVLRLLQFGSWSDLGFQMQDIPSLRKLMDAEGRITAFIHCFMVVQKIATLHELEMAICKNEGVKTFEDLHMGPLLSHPLVLQYFLPSGDASGVCKLKSEHIIAYLSALIDEKGNETISVNEFLDFVAKKLSVASREKLGVRIQSLGMYVQLLKDAKKLQDFTKRKWRRVMKLKERYIAVTERVETFNSVNKEFCGKHIRFESSSEHEDVDESSGSEERDINERKSENERNNVPKLPVKTANSSEQVSSCPYPSAAEELTRLGLSAEMDNRMSRASGSSRHNKKLNKRSRKIDSQSCNSEPVPKKKRKIDSLSFSISSSGNLLKRDGVKPNVLPIQKENEGKKVNDLDEVDFSLSTNSMRTFITTWKEACKEQCLTEVLKRMLHFYALPGHKFKRVQLMKAYPIVGLLNVAVMSIKNGMWDSMYDAIQDTAQCNQNNQSDSDTAYETINVDPPEKDVKSDRSLQHVKSVTVEEIVRKIGAYLGNNHEIQNGKTLQEQKLIFLKRLCECEYWLSEQFSVREFKSLGFGEFFMFLGRHFSLLPIELQNFLAGGVSEKSPLEVCVLQQLLTVFVAQASQNVWQNESITKEMIQLLFMRQFPLLCFTLTENSHMENFLKTVEKHKNDIVSKHVLFSASLFGTNKICHSLASLSGPYSGEESVMAMFVMSKGAIDVLLRAPMMADLCLWSHWDFVFAPSLGPIVPWLLNEVRTRELLCLVTRDGRVIRLDHSATPDKFLEAALKGSSFETSVQLLSLFSVSGGSDHFPSSLLKCYAEQAVKVNVKNYLEDMVIADAHIADLHGQQIHTLDITREIKPVTIDKAVHLISRFVLDCLSLLPLEFHGFAADILLYGLRSTTKSAPSVILSECNNLEERLMLHDLGLTLGIMEWVQDHHAFSATHAADLNLSSKVTDMKTVQFKSHLGSNLQSAMLNPSSTEGEIIIHGGTDRRHRECGSVDIAEGSNSGMSNACEEKSDISELTDAALVIESIRREEFGLDSNISDVENCMLKKQHARLGRALQCLSQELYSQDSHFLLELIQNADDNIYSQTVEPTLTFILQESGITVLNNEEGFSAQNIRALCDVGSSTKCGGVGYIGKKGIGFKSVFRVTDAPEIHSNGFHVKFDITDGQIGFVLPAQVPPCNIEYFRELLRWGTNELDDKCWKTCIILPFASRIDMVNILAMFSDLHPSLLLFLHRLDCIVFRNVVNDSLTVMKKKVVGNGLVKVSLGKDKMTWFVASQKLQADAVRRDLQMTEIAIAFTLHESLDGYCSPVLDQQPVFAFLPLRAYGLKFILQGDFILPSSREEVDGNSAWNQWLLSEFPGLFVSAEKSFCALPCFREMPGKAVAAFMSFVPLVGEVHGFFSSLPRMIISKLRVSNCLLVEGDKKEWVPPCKVLRCWTEEARRLFPDDLLHEHLGLGFLDKDIVLSDALASALGIEEYGPRIMVQILSSMCLTNGLSSMGVSWLSSWLNEFFLLSFRSSHHVLLHSGIDTGLINKLKNIPFILLSNGTFTSVNEGPVWVHLEMMNGGFDTGLGLEAFPNLSGKLRIVSPALFSLSDVGVSCMDMSFVGNITRVLHSIGVQQLSAHDILKVHILPALSNGDTEDRDKALMIDYLCFVMIHLQSNCPSCCADRAYIIAELQNKALILTNYGLKRLTEVSVHFGKEFGNPIDIKRMISNGNMKWHEVDIAYLQHSASKSLSSVLNKWREFFQEIGVMDFVQVVHVDKSLASMPTLVEQFMLDLDLVSKGSFVRDWESHELVLLLSLLSESSNREGCIYLLEVLDRLWDDYFSEKTKICFNSKSIGSRHVKSSFLCKLSEVQWVASSMDNKLHLPKDLFHDCDSVRSILGASAPFVVPKVASRKLIEDLGFRSHVSMYDVLEVLKLWRCQTFFRASIAQMSRLYSFIWSEIHTVKQTNIIDFYSVPFIFVPYKSGSGPEDVVGGAFLSAKEVYWHDSTGTTESMQARHNFAAAAVSQHPLDRSLCNVYPGLRAFFVRECGVPEQPSFHDYLQMISQLSAIALPSQAADSVFQVFLKWAEGLKSGVLGSEDITRIREYLTKQEFTVLPTLVDKWASLHPSFGLVCWCDDKKLRKEFKNLDTIDFLYFGNLDKHKQELLNTKVSALLQALGVPVLSDVVSREAIYDGAVSNGFKSSLVNWALPFAQRYLYSVHPEKYLRMKHSGFANICNIQVIVVEKLYYRNVIKSCGIASKKRIESSCLLQGDVLYTTSGSDSHALFLELSRLLFDGTPDLHFANFLHMITTMVESGSTEEQTEFFILNSQKMPKLPADESVWQLSSLQSSEEGSEMPQSSSPLALTDGKGTLRPSRRQEVSSWPPIDWKSAPGFGDARANGFTKTPASVPALSGGSGEETLDAKADVGDGYVVDSTVLIFPEPENVDLQHDKVSNQTDSNVKMIIDSVDLSLASNPTELGSFEVSGRDEHNFGSVSSGFSTRDQLHTGTPSQAQALLTGKLGELAAFKYYTETLGRTKVRWVNKDSETGLPYDLVIGDDGEYQEFVEVKATRSARKDWFNISTREWQVAAEMGESFIIIHVLLSSDKEARLTLYRNPVKLCQQGKLQLVVLMPKQRNDFSVKS